MINVKLLREMSTIKQYSSGAVIIRDGDAGEDMFILLKGNAGVYKHYGHPNKIHMATLTPGSFFGETTVFLKNNYLTTVVALDDVIALAINRANAYKFFDMELTATKTLVESLSTRIAEVVSHCRNIRPSDIDVNGDSNNFFSDFQSPYTFNIQRLNENYIQHAKAGQVLVQQGDNLNKTCIFLQGSADVYTDYKKPDPVKKAELHAGHVYSKAIFPDAVADVTIVASSDSQVLSLTPENTVRFFECESQSIFIVVKTLCERLVHIHKVHDNLCALSNKSKGYSGHSLFPEKHKNYDMELTDAVQYLQLKHYSCPVCKGSFKAFIADTNKLTVASTDDDYRINYLGGEPIYFDIITCPHCWYSALKEYFDKGMATKYLFVQDMQQNKSSLHLNTEKIVNINDVFAAYYLALFCAKTCFSADRDLVIGKLWLRLSWIYQDCKDDEMYDEATKKAHAAFMDAYVNSTAEGKAAQQLLLLAGVLCHKVGDDKSAKHMLSQAKYTRNGVDALKDRATTLLKNYNLID